MNFFTCGYSFFGYQKYYFLHFMATSLTFLNKEIFVHSDYFRAKAILPVNLIMLNITANAMFSGIFNENIMMDR